MLNPLTLVNEKFAVRVPLRRCGIILLRLFYADVHRLHNLVDVEGS